MAMFIRVKRKKTTYFLQCDPTETVLEIKQKIQALSDNPVDCQRLILLNTRLILDDNKTLADQKTAPTAPVAPLAEDSGTGTKDETVQGLHGVPLEDAKSLAEQQVENDAIVALCLKISDPRVHRIPTLMRKLGEPYIPTPTPTPPPEPPAEGQEPPPLPPPERRMSTTLRVPYRPPPVVDTENDKKASQTASAVKKTGSLKKQLPSKDGGKKESAKSKAGIKTKGDMQGGKTLPKKGGKDNAKAGKAGMKKGTRKGKDETPTPTEEIVEPKRDSGVWEDIVIDKLTDYTALIDSD